MASRHNAEAKLGDPHSIGDVECKVVVPMASKHVIRQKGGDADDDDTIGDQRKQLCRSPSSGGAAPTPAPRSQNNAFLAVAYSILNIVSASAIVFANKAVFQVFGFKFVFALTLIHTLFTWIGMTQLSAMGFFTPKQFNPMQLLPLAIGYVGYIVLGNLSLKLNSVGFYQIMKVAVAPSVLLLEFLLFTKRQSLQTVLSVFIVCCGITIATVTDPITISNSLGLAIGVAATLVTALYQIWAGSKQKDLEASSTQLLLGYTPQALLLLAILTPIFEPMGWQRQEPGTLLGYQYTAAAVGAILLSAALGVLVSLSTFLVIGATSSLSYNIVGHLKTVIILSGGCLLFNDVMSWARLSGLLVAMVGIVWYTTASMSAAQDPKLKPAEAAGKKAIP